MIHRYCIRMMTTKANGMQNPKHKTVRNKHIVRGLEFFFSSYKNNFHKTLVYANACLLGTQHYECLPLLCDVPLLPCSQL